MPSAGSFLGQKSQRIRRWLLWLAPLALLEEVKLSTIAPLVPHWLFTILYPKNDMEKTVQMLEIFQSQNHVIHTRMKNDTGEPFCARQRYVVPRGCKGIRRAGTTQMCPGTGTALLQLLWKSLERA